MKVKVMIRDGIIETVLGDDEALQSDIEIEVIDFDRNRGNVELYNKEYDEDGLSDLPYLINHCEENEEY